LAGGNLETALPRTFVVSRARCLGDAEQGRYEDALPPLRRVFQISPTFPRIRANLGESLRRRGDQLAETGRPNEAQALFKEALQLQP
jgi:Flp pilus assembly protein TadD